MQGTMWGKPEPEHFEYAVFMQQFPMILYRSPVFIDFYFCKKQLLHRAVITSRFLLHKKYLSHRCRN